MRRGGTRTPWHQWTSPGVSGARCPAPIVNSRTISASDAISASTGKEKPGKGLTFFRFSSCANGRCSGDRRTPGQCSTVTRCGGPWACVRVMYYGCAACVPTRPLLQPVLLRGLLSFSWIGVFTATSHAQASYDGHRGHDNIDAWQVCWRACVCACMQASR